VDSQIPDARYAPTQVRIEDIEVEPTGLVLASRGSRVWAAIIDCLVLAVPMVLFFTFSPLTAPGEPPPGFWDIQFRSPIAGSIAFVLCNGYLLFIRGQTIGKHFLKIRIARPSGERVSMPRLCVRQGIGYVFSITSGLALIYCLFDCLPIFHSARRCLHDWVADTAVLKR
jgi:uncharacterized RDD family membrane protein YckC